MRRFLNLNTQVILRHPTQDKKQSSFVQNPLYYTSFTYKSLEFCLRILYPLLWEDPISYHACGSFCEKP
jgi:hypothetical protein